MAWDEAKLNLPATRREVIVASTQGRIATLRTLTALRALKEGDLANFETAMRQADEADTELGNILAKMGGWEADAK